MSDSEREKARSQEPKAKKAKQKPQEPKKDAATGLEKPLATAYRVMGSKSHGFLPLFKDLDQTLQKSGLKANFKAYVSLTLVASFAIAVPVAVATSLLLYFLFNMPLITALLFGVGAALFAWAISIGGFYLYPVYRADKHKRELDDELPFTTGYMAILASAGVSPEKIFHSLSNLSAPLAASSETKEIIKNINLFGLDIISALEKVSTVTPSKKLQETIEGMISTIHTGGNLGAYLREKFKTHMKLKKVSLKKYADSLSVMSEVYVALLLTGPLLLIIMLSVMSMLGGGAIGMFSSDLLLNLMTYIGIPVAAIIFLLILDSTTPKW
ncbi:MAG: type II secretion system F family protein [Candidatus Bathyarchaeota archaeon]|nr:type II secretion system F family protein [Candidatus Bathyarchaeota archaeon]